MIRSTQLFSFHATPLLSGISSTKLIYPCLPILSSALGHHSRVTNDQCDHACSLEFRCYSQVACHSPALMCVQAYLEYLAGFCYYRHLFADLNPTTHFLKHCTGVAENWQGVTYSHRRVFLLRWLYLCDLSGKTFNPKIQKSMYFKIDLQSTKTAEFYYTAWLCKRIENYFVCLWGGGGTGLLQALRSTQTLMWLDSETYKGSSLHNLIKRKKSPYYLKLKFTHIVTAKKLHPHMR